jgi:hypothetical protein
MIAKSCLTTFIFFLVIETHLGAQVFDNPAIGLKSHQTMEISRIDRQQDRTLVYVSVENRINGGTFCADKNIFIIQPDGSRLKLEKASGIPNCPASHKFKRVGEVLEFTLIFPALEPVTGWFNLIEECTDNCFSVYGILLNSAFTARIDLASSYVDKGQIDTAIGLYQSMINEAGEREAGIKGSLYTDLVSLLSSKGYKANAAEWYRKLAESDVPQKELYLNNLNFRGIKY